MSPRIVFLIKELAFYSLGGVLFIFFKQGLFRDFNGIWEYFFDLDPEGGVVAFLNVVFLIITIAVIALYVHFYLDRNKKDEVRSKIKSTNELVYIIGGVYLAICTLFISGNFISYKYVGVYYTGEATEYGTFNKRGNIYDAEDKLGIERTLNKVEYAKYDVPLENAHRYRFLFEKSAVFEGYHVSGDDSYKGFFGFLGCMVSHIIENAIFLLMCFCLPMLIIIILTEIEYKK
jgi:hypothetical protein